VLRLEDLAEPFFLFDERTRRQRRTGGPIPPGRYWLLHRAADTLVDAEERYDWPDGDRALSLLQIRPGAEATLESGDGGSSRFVAAITPFFDDVGVRLSHEDREPLCFGWPNLPYVWLPVDETERLAQWQVRLFYNDTVEIWGLLPTGDESGGMAKFHIDSSNFLTKLPPAVYNFMFILELGEHNRIEAQTEYLFWKGLKGHDAKGFRLGTLPENILRSNCLGFEFGETFIRHLSDQYRRHTLAFDVDGSQLDFHWSQPGVFLESLERQAGKPAKLHSHQFGETFFASLNSERWLRIWIAGQTGWEVIVEGKSWQRDVGKSLRDFIELSLASLAMAFPHGGEIKLRSGGGDWLLARFTSPLQPITIDRVDEELTTGFRFNFPEPVEWMRPVLSELASGKRYILDGQFLSQSGICVFATDGFPNIECSNLVTKTVLYAASDYAITLHVPKVGWPVGAWLIDLEIRRDEHSDYEIVTLKGRDYAPVAILNPNTQTSTKIRERLFWACFAPGNQPRDFSLDFTEQDELFGLIMDLISLRQNRFCCPAGHQLGERCRAVD
jgi:hypothetical protein